MKIRKFTPKFGANLPDWVKVSFRLLQAIGPVVIFGFIMAFGLLFLFAELTEDVFSQQFSNLDNNFELWLHNQATPFLDLVFNFFTLIGGLVAVPLMAALVFGFLVWQKRYYWAWLLVIGLAGGLLMNQVLKLVFHRTRPDLWSLPTRLTSYSYPSGHATASFCFFSLLAWIGIKYLKNTMLKIFWVVAMGLIILLVGLSRVYLGEHYPTDVIGGWLSSALWLLVLLNSGYFLKKKRQTSRISETARGIEQG